MVIEAGEFLGKFSASMAIKLAKEIILDSSIES